MIAARGRDIEDVDREIEADKLPRRVTPAPGAVQPVENTKMLDRPPSRCAMHRRGRRHGTPTPTPSRP